MSSYITGILDLWSVEFGMISQRRIALECDMRMRHAYGLGDEVKGNDGRGRESYQTKVKTKITARTQASVAK